MSSAQKSEAAKQSESKAQVAKQEAVSAEYKAAKKQEAVRNDAAAKARVDNQIKSQSVAKTTAAKGISASTTNAAAVNATQNAAATKTPVENAAESARAAQAERDAKMPAAQERLDAAKSETQTREAAAATSEPGSIASNEQATQAARAEQSAAQNEVDRLNENVTKTQEALSEVTKAETTKAITTRDESVRQATVDSLSRAAEVAGTEGAKTMGEAAAAAINADSNPTQAASKFGYAAQQSIEKGQGALMGVQTAASLTGAPRARVASAAARGIDAVKREFDAAAAGVGKHEARLAQFNAVHGQSLSPEQNEAARQQFTEAAAKENARYDAASKNLLSAAQGAEAATNTGVAGVMGDHAAGARSTMREVRDAVPAALKTDAGQAHLKEALSSAPSGQLSTHLVARSDAEAKAMTGALSSAVMSESGASRAQALQDVATHGGQLGMPEMKSLEVRDALAVLSNGQTSAELKTGLSTLSGALGKLSKGTTSTTGGFGAALGLTSAALSLKDAQSVTQVGEASSKLGYSVSSIAGDVLDSIGKSSGFARQFANVAETSLGRAASVFDGVNALGALAKGDNLQAGISAASAAGAILSTAGKRALGGYVGLAASAAQAGYEIYKSGQESKAYNEQTRAVFESMGFSSQSAQHLASMRQSSAAIFSDLGRGQGLGGTDLSASEVFQRAPGLSDEQIKHITGLNRVLPRNDSGQFDSNVGGVMVEAWRENLENLRSEMFQ